MRLCRHRQASALMFATAIAAPLASSAPAPPQAVDLELVLATDNSQSIDRSEALLQRQGIAAAFKHPDVVRAIQAGTYGRIAVAYVDWSSLPYSKLTIDWRIVGDKASADSLRRCVLGRPLLFGQGTAIGETLEIAAQMIETNTIEGTQRSIDISGDGPNNTGPPVHRCATRSRPSASPSTGFPSSARASTARRLGHLLRQARGLLRQLRHRRTARVRDSRQGLSGIRRSRAAQAGAGNFRYPALRLALIVKTRRRTERIAGADPASPSARRKPRTPKIAAAVSASAISRSHGAARPFGTHRHRMLERDAHRAGFLVRKGG